MTRGIGCLVLMVVVLVVAYQQYNMEKMRGEVGAISTKLGIDGGKQSGGSNLVRSMAEAEKHAKKARDLMDKKKFDQAQAELDKVLASLESANSASSEITGDVADLLGKARHKAVKVFQNAWEDISEETKSNDEQ